MNGPSYRPNKRPGQRATRQERSPASKTRTGQAQGNYLSNTLLNNVTADRPGR